MTQETFDSVMGRLDHSLSEVILVSKEKDLTRSNIHTLTLHAEHAKEVGKKVEENLQYHQKK